ncbi:MAG: branched-chain amino acid ABC transporter permease [Halobacteriota archaeon]|uniref:branched-chain amino acid ABC transporter permease n=1 Tax=Natronomonas sp. TaxID=2184060 RepID=UPI0039770381
MNVTLPRTETSIGTTSLVLLALTALTVIAVAVGALSFSYLLYLLALSGMYVMLALGLNVQWGYGGIINFAVVAFWGLGMYVTALSTARTSPLGLDWHPLVALVVAIVLSVVAAIIVGLPAIRLRADYLAIATLGFSEIFRLIMANESDFTAGMAGLAGIPRILEELFLTTTATNLMIITILSVVVYLLLRRIHRSPWGRVMRTIKADEELAESLGKDSFSFKMQAFVIGCVIMTIAGVYYAHFINYVDPTDLQPLQTFYIWVAVILGGSGSNRGAVVGGIVLVAVLEGTRFVTSIGALAAISTGPVRVLTIGLLIILIMRFKPEGIYPPRDELIWPKSMTSTEDGK